MADSRFKQGQYEDALKRYRSLWTSPDVTIRKRLDELYFRSGYAECQLGRWKEALACFERLQREYPHSKLAGKAVCLEYVAAAGRYKRNPGEANYSRYIASARRYLKECPNPRDRDGAHFVLGEDYRKKGKPGKARKEFAFITKGSPHYWPARYYMVKTDVEALEKRTKKGGKKSAGTKKLYQNLAAQLALFQKLAQRKHPEPGIADVAPQMTILQARLSACCTPEESCSQVTRILKDFEKRFPGNRPLWLEAMRLRLACYEQHRMIDASKGQILYLSKKYPLDEDLWDFLGEWAERYDKKAKALRPPHDPALGDGYRKLSLMIYTKMAELAAGEARYGKYLDTIRIRMGEILLALGRTQRAARIYEALLKRAPDSAEALYHLGTIYQGQGRWNAALRVWRKYSKGMDAGCDAWLDARYRIALAHSEMGGPAEACEVITMIRVLHPHMEDAELKQKLLDLEKKVCAPGATDQASGSRR